jgi:hypothetical protein
MLPSWSLPTVMGDVGSKTTFPCGVVDEVDLLNSNSKSGPRDHSYSWGVRQKAGGEHYPGSRFEVQCARFNFNAELTTDHRTMNHSQNREALGGRRKEGGGSEYWISDLIASLIRPIPFSPKSLDLV